MMPLHKMWSVSHRLKFFCYMIYGDTIDTACMSFTNEKYVSFFYAIIYWHVIIKNLHETFHDLHAFGLGVIQRLVPMGESSDECPRPHQRNTN